MLKQRVLTALVLLALLGLILFTQGVLAWQVFLLLTAALAAEEWAALGFPALAVRLGYVMASGLAAGMLLFLPAPSSHFSLLLFVLALLFWSLVVPVWLGRGWRLAPGLLFLAVGWVVILPTVAALLALRQSGVDVLLACMAVVWVSDICAYFVGRAFGRHRLAPMISPGKTWEGVAGALAGVALFGWLVASSASGPQLALLHIRAGWAWLPVLAVVAAFGIEGDLFESWLKRCAGIKDSGWILPGHGGVLDRIDALTAALPIAALMIGLA